MQHRSHSQNGRYQSSSLRKSFGTHGGNASLAAEVLEVRALLSATFALTADTLVLGDFTQDSDETLIVQQNGANYEFLLTEGTWTGIDTAAASGTGTATLIVDSSSVANLSSGISIDASGVTADVLLQSADFSTLTGGIEISGGGTVTQAVGETLIVPRLEVSAVSIVIAGELIRTDGSLVFLANRDVLVVDGSIIAESGPILIEADSIALGQSSTISNPTGLVTLRPRSAGRQVSIGESGNTSSATLNLDATLISRIQAESLTIGSSSAGDICFTSAVAPDVTSLFRIISGDDVIISADIDLRHHPGASVDVTANGEVVLTDGARLAVVPAFPPPPTNLGALDTTFGSEGIVQVPLANGSGAYGAAIQPDGKILISGGYSIARLNPDGTLDVTFGDGGIVYLPYGARAVTLQPDGKIIIGGGSSNYEYAVQRLNADGSADQSFGVDGAALADFRPVYKFIWEVAVQPDGKILASGFTDTGGGDFVLVRFNADGTLDQSFGNAGIVFTDVGSNTDFAADMVLRPDGRIILVGGSGGKFAIVQYLPNGSLDTTFGSGGKVTTNFGIGSSARGASLLPDGRLVVVGPAGNLDHVVLARYLTDGSLDRSFGSLGLVRTGVGRISDNPQMALQADGGIIVAAESLESQRGFRLIRYTPNGEVDDSYSFPLVNFGGSSLAAPEEVLVQSDGRIVVAGRAAGSGNALVARYLAAAGPVGQVRLTAQDIKVDHAATIENANGHVELSATGVVVIEGDIASGSGSTIVVAARLTGTGEVQGSLIVSPETLVTNTANSSLALTTAGLVLQNGSEITVRFHTTGINFIPLVVTSSEPLRLEGATLNTIWTAPNISAGSVYTVIDNEGTGEIDGTFAGLPEGAVVATVGGRVVRITYRGGDGNDVELYVNSLVGSGERFLIGEAGHVTGDLLANDFDPDGDVLRITAVNGNPDSLGQLIVLASGARLVVYDDGSFAYDPAGAFDWLPVDEVRYEIFTYTISDGIGGTSTERVDIEIRGSGTVLVADLNPSTTDVGNRQGAPDVAISEDGTVILAWTHEGNSGDLHIRFRRYTSNGIPLDLTDRRVVGRSAQVEHSPKVAIAADNSFVIGYVATSADGTNRVYCDFYDRDGRFVRSVSFFEHEQRRQSDLELDMTPTGAVVAVWRESHSGSDPQSNIFAQVLSASGMPSAGPILVANGSENAKPSVAVDRFGNFVVAFSFDDRSVAIQRYSFDGRSIGRQSILQPSAGNIGDRFKDPYVGRAWDGSFVVAYTIVPGSGDSFGYWHLLDASGIPGMSRTLQPNRIVTDVDMDAMGNFVIGVTHTKSGEPQSEAILFDSAGRQVGFQPANQNGVGVQNQVRVAIWNNLLATSYVDESSNGGDVEFSVVEQQRDKVAVARPNSSGGLTFFLDSNGNRSLDALDESFDFGLAGDIVVVGDWDGDGIDEVGVARSNGSGGLTFFLDSNGNNIFDDADTVFHYGLVGDEVVTGDWNGDGVDDVGVARSNGSGGLTFFLDSNGSRFFEDWSDVSFNFGLDGDRIAVGDWNGDGTDDVGVARSNGSGGLTYFLDSNGSRFFEGFRDSTFDFGLDQHRIAVGDWDGNGIDGVGVVQPRGDMGSNVVQDVNENQLFDATDELFTFDFGLPDDLLLAGYWRHTALQPS